MLDAVLVFLLHYPRVLLVVVVDVRRADVTVGRVGLSFNFHFRFFEKRMRHRQILKRLKPSLELI